MRDAAVIDHIVNIEQIVVDLLRGIATAQWMYDGNAEVNGIR